MIKFIEEHIADIILIILLAIILISALVVIRRKKGRCAYCSMSDTCPFKKKNH